MYFFVCNMIIYGWGRSQGFRITEVINQVLLGAFPLAKNKYLFIKLLTFYLRIFMNYVNMNDSAAQDLWLLPMFTANVGSFISEVPNHLKKRVRVKKKKVVFSSCNFCPFSNLFIIL